MRAQTAVAGFARQAIVGRDQRVVAYELLYRGERHADAEGVTDDVQATRSVIARSLHALGLQRSVGNARAFINMNAESLTDQATEALPPRHVVLEILESVAVTGTLIDRCRYLKARGFRLALDDFTHYEERYRPLLDLVDIVKVDLLQVAPHELGTLVSGLRRHPAQLLAEKVDCERCAVSCLAHGFDYFQGYFFGRPQAIAC